MTATLGGVLRNAVRMQGLIMGPAAKSMETPKHDPVMVEEIAEALSLREGQTYVDGTLGLGGHALQLCPALGKAGLLIGIDWDADMLRTARHRLKGLVCKQEFHHDTFKNWHALIGARKVDGILLDLGLNSAQVDDPARGFSFQATAPLDMRMDRSRGEPASALLNRLGPGEIEEMLRVYGDERWARMIARKIVERRRERPLRTTDDLNQCVYSAIPPAKRDPRIHASTRTFQAVRIYVNRELDELDEALEVAAGSLNAGGTLAVLSYHSGEDRIAKQVFRRLAEQGYEELDRKPVEASETEVRRNPRSRSAKLRCLRRLAVGA